MSLYRQPGRHGTTTIVVVAVVAFLGGAAIAFFAGRASAPDPSLSEQLAGVRDDLQPARQGLEILPAEYAQSVAGGAAGSPAEIAGVTANVARVRDTVAAQRASLRVISPAATAALERDLAGLAGAVAAKAPAARVERLIEAAKADLAVFLDER